MNRTEITAQARRYAADLFEARELSDNQAAERVAISMIVAALGFIEHQSGPERVRRVVGAAMQIAASDRASIKH